ncbi:zinc-dependent metalloprotease [Pedobacter sp. MC2016-24]|uniref:zinc-dependent metalloprotease n=1 Tax=Pedobacter sp. MC2016-24 TaxID=2780090 RepID=UPI0018827C4C|nr:zinc-dependent metalloprotease [Pedobacter sp. MC2016-24]MBE9599578.1 zinc-dependent metalloprotease [Pedobacter sp. MC2016-24]
MKPIKILFLSLGLTVSAFFCANAQTEVKVPTIATFTKPAAKQYKGMFNVIVQDDKYFIEIPDQLLGRDILTSITIISGSAQRKRNPAMRFGFAGDAVNDRVIRFNKGINGKMNLIAPEFAMETDTMSMYFNALKAKLVPSLLAFDIVATGNASSVIDITSLFAGDNDLFSLKGAAVELKLGAFEPQKSKVLGVSAFENNVIFRSIKSYGEAAPAAQGPPNATGMPAKKEETNPTMWEVGSSWFLLPEVPMAKRYADKRIGYFLTGLKNYDRNPEKNEFLTVANRWRIEPRPEDLQKFKNGELVEPAKPIVFYIDRNTPAYLIPYMIDGVNAWRKSFEKIGFKNAITGKLAPTAAEDPDYTMEDARYSYISYKPSEMANAYGPQIVDPRSGEILTSHIAVFHNIQELLQRWYFSMCAVTDPGARKVPMDKSLMGTLIRNVITHEVGHTLGLRHNFAGSSSYAVDSIRNRDFVRKNSFGPSVMDYMRFNYAAQPGDKMTPADLLPVVGVYDDYAIEWGYRFMPEKDAQTAADELTSWVSEKRKDPRFFYFEEGDFYDPRVQSEDIGDNNMKANALGVENLKIIMANLNKWGEGDDNAYLSLRSMYRAVQGRYYQYLQHVVKNIGGVFTDNALRAENKSNFVPVSRAQQKEAMDYLTQYMFTEPKWLYPEDIMAKTRFNFDTDVEASYGDLLGRLLSKYSALSRVEDIAGGKDYTAAEFLTDLHRVIFKDIESGKPISRYNRMLQRTFLNSVLRHVDNPGTFPNNVDLKMTELLRMTSTQAEAAAALQTDFISKSHLTAIANMIKVWNTGRNDAYLTK